MYAQKQTDMLLQKKKRERNETLLDVYQVMKSLNVHKDKPSVELGKYLSAVIPLLHRGTIKLAGTQHFKRMRAQPSGGSHVVKEEQAPGSLYERMRMSARVLVSVLRRGNKHHQTCLLLHPHCRKLTNKNCWKIISFSFFLFLHEMGAIVRCRV
jgi:hypothetical protein